MNQICCNQYLTLIVWRSLLLFMEEIFVASARTFYSLNLKIAFFNFFFSFLFLVEYHWKWSWTFNFLSNSILCFRLFHLLLTGIFNIPFLFISFDYFCYYSRNILILIIAVKFLWMKILLKIWHCTHTSHKRNGISRTLSIFIKKNLRLSKHGFVMWITHV